MKQIYTLLSLFFGLNAIGQTTYIPDDNFEQALINFGYDDVLDDYVISDNISNITSLQLEDLDIYDLTGIEDFNALRTLDLSRNFLTHLDVSQNVNLELLDCAQITTLTVLNIQNGNNFDLILGASDCPNLICVQVDDIDYVNSNINSQFYFSGTNNYTLSLDCANLSVDEFSKQNVSIYPNPSKDFITINGVTQATDFNIYNPLGALVKSGSLSEALKIDIRSLNRGLYILQIDKSRAFKIIKE